MRTDNFCFYLQNRLIQTSQTGGQWYSDTSHFSIPWYKEVNHTDPSTSIRIPCYVRHNTRIGIVIAGWPMEVAKGQYTCLIILMLRQGSLTEGKSKYSWPPCTNQIRSARFYFENIIFLFYKTSYLMRRSTVLSLPPQLVFPGCGFESIRCHKYHDRVNGSGVEMVIKDIGFMASRVAQR